MAKKKPKPPADRTAEVGRLAALLARQKTITGLGTLCEKLVEKFGGEDGFAEEFYGTYDAEDTTSATRARMLSDLIGLQTQLAKHTADQNDANDLSMLTDEDLASVLADAADKLRGQRDDDPTPPEVAAAAHPEPQAAEDPGAAGDAGPHAPADDLAAFFERPTAVIPPDPRDAAE